MRAGLGFDAHRFGGEAPLVLCGVVIEDAPGVEATSDGDVATHAVIDALLGGTSLGDLGSFYPSSDSRWRDVSSVDVLLEDAMQRLSRTGWRPVNVDVTIVAQSVRIAPHRSEMRARLATVLQLPESAVSVKATTTDGMGWMGRGEGIAALAVASLTSTE